jgi:plastocyanin
MRKLITTVAVASLAGAVAIPAFAATKTVRMVDSTDDFSPRTLTVKKNDRVKFVWKGEAHNVEADGKKPFANIGIRTSGSVTRKATRRGTFKLECTLHSGMRMTLRVK